MDGGKEVVNKDIMLAEAIKAVLVQDQHQAVHSGIPIKINCYSSEG